MQVPRKYPTCTNIKLIFTDVSNSCYSYILCYSNTYTKGIMFNCPPGTRFEQKTLVCHHENAVTCGDSRQDFRRKESLSRNTDQVTQSTNLPNLDVC